MIKRKNAPTRIDLGTERDSSVARPIRRRLPCSPEHLQGLRLNVPIHFGFKPTTTALTLDRIISVMVRSGPSLNADEQLSNPLYFKELVLSFTWVGLNPTSLMLCPTSEAIVREFRRIQRSSSGHDHPSRRAFESITLEMDYYAQSWVVL